LGKKYNFKLNKINISPIFPEKEYGKIFIKLSKRKKIEYKPIKKTIFTCVRNRKKPEYPI
ncbi:MAG: hypothetical protein ACK5XN_29285, partial [Bacteroidota bacterium]